MSHQVQLHRIVRASPALIYRAFLDPQALAKWVPPNGYTAAVQHLDARVGGSFRMSFTALANGQSHHFGGQYLELQTDQLISYTDQFDDSQLPGSMLTTVRLQPVFCGTELHIIQQGIPDAIPNAACYLGWQESLNLLALLTEAQLPG